LGEVIIYWAEPDKSRNYRMPKSKREIEIKDPIYIIGSSYEN